MDKCAETSLGAGFPQDLLPIAGDWAGTAKKKSLLAISPGLVYNLLIDN
jgi:hypothetical protein